MNKLTVTFNNDLNFSVVKLAFDNVRLHQIKINKTSENYCEENKIVPEQPEPFQLVEYLTWLLLKITFPTIL